MPLSESEIRFPLNEQALYARGWSKGLIRCEGTASLVRIEEGLYRTK